MSTGNNSTVFQETLFGAEQTDPSFDAQPYLEQVQIELGNIERGEEVELATQRLVNNSHNVESSLGLLSAIRRLEPLVGQGDGYQLSYAQTIIEVALSISDIPIPKRDIELLSARQSAHVAASTTLREHVLDRSSDDYRYAIMVAAISGWDDEVQTAREITRDRTQAVYGDVSPIVGNGAVQLENDLIRLATASNSQQADVELLSEIYLHHGRRMEGEQPSDFSQLVGLALNVAIIHRNSHLARSIIVYSVEQGYAKQTETDQDRLLSALDRSTQTRSSSVGDFLLNLDGTSPQRLF